MRLAIRVPARLAPWPGRLATLAAVLILTASAGLLPSPAPAQVPTAAGAEQRVVVRGNRRIEAETILSYMQLTADQTVTAETLNLAVRRLFDTGLFQDVRIVPTEDALVVEVAENPSINEIAFEGNDALSDEDLRRVIELRARLPFTRSAAEADAQTIIELYRRTGRFGAEVEPVIIERPENRVDLVFEIEEGDLTGVSSIDFVGNEAFSDRRLRRVIETTESGIFDFLTSSDVYDPDRLQLDEELLRSFYLSRGYADFSVLSTTAELSPDRSGFFITFTVQEGPQYDFGEFDVVVDQRGLEPEEFLALIPDDLTGETYDAEEVEEIATEMTDLAGQRGFAFVQVRPRADRDPEALTIDITFELIEGSRIFVERIDIEGNVQTLDRVIRREIDLVEGDAFDARKIRNARAAIRGLGYFSEVGIETEEGTADDRAILKVRVEEQPTGSLSFGLGFSSNDGPLGQVAITERNFLGRGQQVAARVTAAGDTQIYDFSFTEPRFLDRNLAVGVRGFFLQRDQDDESSFEQDRLGFIPRVAFPLGEVTRLELRYEIVRDDIQVDADASPAIRVEDGARLKSSVGWQLSYDGRNDRIETTEGVFARLNTEIAGLGGDARFIKTSGSVKGWQGFFDDLIVASLEVEAGNILGIGEDTSILDRFFLGGQSFRGFASEGIGPRDTANPTQDALGGNSFIVARLQTSFPIGLPEDLGIFGGAFLEAGTVFGLDETDFVAPPGSGLANVSIDDGANFRVTVGGLLFVDSPFGPLELSLGVPIVSEDFDDEELFRLSVGTRF